MPHPYPTRLFFLLISFGIFAAGAGISFFSGKHTAGIICLCGTVGCILLIYHYINAVNRKISYFFSALKNEDFTLRFTEKRGLKSEKLLNCLLNQTKEILQKTRINIQQQEKYYELILNNINSGVVALNSKGFVLQSNLFARKILGLEVFTHTRQLQKVSLQLQQAVEEIQSGETKRITYTNERGSVQLLINATSIIMNGEKLILLVFNDIENEMDETEIDSWIRLIRVLAHEIMNSIAPITSLSDTLLSLQKNDDPETDASQLKENTINGLRVISETGKGLISFVDSYRKFTRIPKPEREYIDMNEFIHRMVILCSMEPSFGNITIHTEIQPENLRVYADPNLLGQVVLNIMKNAIQAMQGTKNGKLQVSVENHSNQTIIKITDNGPGIAPEILNEIFVPFFTTKSEGTGIGLSIARQIMRTHGGNIKVTSIPEKETTFTLTL